MFNQTVDIVAVDKLADKDLDSPGWHDEKASALNDMIVDLTNNISKFHTYHVKLYEKKLTQ